MPKTPFFPQILKFYIGWPRNPQSATLIIFWVQHWKNKRYICLCNQLVSQIHSSILKVDKATIVDND